MSSDPQSVVDPTRPTVQPRDDDPEPPFSVFSRWEKPVYCYVASLAGFSSPVSSSIYLPALLVLAKDLNTSLSNIYLTITVYMIFQGVAPTVIGGISDRYGRRPAYLICFVIYIGANTGLALQTSFAALMVLRCVQSSGSSGTTALSSAVVSDLATRAERGSYIGLAALGQSLGPALGPLIGGLLTHFLGWRSIFWFLDIYAGCILFVIVVFMPETCRNIVGNGSVPPQKWNVSLTTVLRNRRRRKQNKPESTFTLQKRHRPGLLSSIPILFQKSMFLLLVYGGILYAGFYIVLTGLPSQLGSTYHYNSIQIGLCYLPIGAGIILSKSVVGRLLDWNFRRYARACNIPIIKTRQTDITNFPIERARLEIGLLLVYLGCVTIIPYGWVMNMPHPPLPAALVLLFFNGFTTSGSFQALTVLTVDCNPDNPAAASAANNLIRCIMGAGGVAIVVPLLDKIGRGWTSVLIAGVWVLFSLFWWAVMWYGMSWRAEKAGKEKTKQDSCQEKEDAKRVQVDGVTDHDKEMTQRV